MALFALRCVQAAAETLVDKDDPFGGHVVIRAGFHSGPVVANVVGTKYRSIKFLHCNIIHCYLNKKIFMKQEVFCSW